MGSYVQRSLSVNISCEFDQNDVHVLGVLQSNMYTLYIFTSTVRTWRWSSR